MKANISKLLSRTVILLLVDTQAWWIPFGPFALGCLVGTVIDCPLIRRGAALSNLFLVHVGRKGVPLLGSSSGTPV